MKCLYLNVKPKFFIFTVSDTNSNLFAFQIFKYNWKNVMHFEKKIHLEDRIPLFLI